jgi:phosphoglycolate phosphatase-like HAD superfamily hydrolase
MSIRLVVFDLAGTTVRDSDNVHYFLQEALRKEGIAISRQDANAVMGIAKPVAIRQLLEARLTDHSASPPPGSTAFTGTFWKA